MSVAVSVMLGNRFNAQIVAFVFSSSCFAYTFQRLVKLNLGIPFSAEHTKWMIENRGLVWVILLLTGFSVFCLMLFFSLYSWLLFFIIGLVALFYVGFRLPEKILSLRSIPFIKAHLVSFSWSALLVCLPYFESEGLHDGFPIRVFLATYFFIFSVAVIFDVRDLTIDNPSLRTIPQMTGAKMTRLIAIVSMFSAYGLAAYQRPEWCFGIVILFALWVLLVALVKNKSALFYATWVDGYLLLPGVFTFFSLA